MIPVNGKVYNIDYYTANLDDPMEAFYQGPATYTGEMEDEDLYIFTILGEKGYHLFAEEDIVSEITE